MGRERVSGLNLTVPCFTFFISVPSLFPCIVLFFRSASSCTTLSPS